MDATISDIKAADKIVTDSIKNRRGSGKYSDRLEAIMLTYDNVYKNGNDCVIRLKNGTYKSIYDYI